MIKFFHRICKSIFILAVFTVHDAVAAPSFVAIQGDHFIAVSVVKNDTIWTFGSVVHSVDRDSLTFKTLLIVDYSEGFLRYTDTSAIVKVDINEIDEATSEYYQLKYRDHLFNLVNRIWKEADLYYQIDRKKSLPYFQALKKIVDYLNDEELTFFRDQLALFTEDPTNLGKKSLEAYQKEDYEQTLFYSRIYSLLFEPPSQLSYEVQEAEFSAILSLDFSGRYVPYVNDNYILIDILARWRSEILPTELMCTIDFEQL